MGVDIADINNDGNADIFITDMLPEADQRVKSVMEFEGYNVFKLKQSKDLADSDGHWSYSLNGGDTVMVYATELGLTDLPNGDHSILISLVDNTGTALDPVVEQTIEFSTFNGSG